ncbi:helix-turn-helix transcriptional regulator [bacterium]|nr:helix-turn-helix transcriptional regulator [bacterium]
MELKKNFGLRLKELRKSKNWTQEQLAELVSVDTKHISFLETGRNFPSADLLEKFKNVFEVDYKDIFNFKSYGLNKKDYQNRINSILDNMTENQVYFIYKMVLELK